MKSIVLDSGATLHVCNDRTRFPNLVIADEDDSSLAGEGRVAVQGYRSVDIRPSIIQADSTIRRKTVTMHDIALVSTFPTRIALLRKFINQNVYRNTETNTPNYIWGVFCIHPTR